MKRLVLCLTMVTLLLSACRRPTELAVEWQPVDNSVGSWKFFRSEFTLENRGERELGSRGWKLYFSFVRRILDEGEGDATGIQALAAQGIRLSRAGVAKSGDYYVLEPLPGFVPLRPGEKRKLSVLASDWAVLKSDAPAGFHIVFEGGPFGADLSLAVPATVRLDAADPKQTTRFEGDVLPVQTPALRYAENPSFQSLDLKARLLPTPRQVDVREGEVVLGGAVGILHAPGLGGEAAYLAAALGDVLSASITTREAQGDAGSERIRLSIDSALDVDGDGDKDAEGYVLEVEADGVSVVGSDAAGVFYGIQTLRQLVPVEAYAASVNPTSRPAVLSLPRVRITDVPGFAYRGMSLDVARHFQTKETVKKLLDVLAHYKVNALHLRLADDEGWRIEVPGIPELTTYGARRGYALQEAQMLQIGLGSGGDLAQGDGVAFKPESPTEANGGVAPRYQGFERATLNFVGAGHGYYTVKDYEELLAYAAERHIDVIPEIDMPGHARAAVKAMEYRFRKYQGTDPVRAAEYRLVDPADTSVHTSVQGYTDNFVNPCLESTYAFLAKVAQELKARHDAVPGARLLAIHAGGDELPSLAANVWWQGSPVCQQNPETRGLTDVQLFNRFFTRWGGLITATGVAATGWDDIIHHGLDLPGFIPMPWSNVWGWGREDDAYRYANQGSRVILSHATNLYMDLAYNKDPDEPGYYWANFVDEKKTFEYRPFDVYVNGTADRMGNPIDPSAWATKERLTEAGRKNILGMHGLLFGENVKTPQVMEYLAFPKILGVAERAWNPELPAPDQMPALWARFANSLGQSVLPRLGAYRPVDVRGELPDSVGVNYRIPLPGARRTGGKVHANVRFPGLVIEYSADGGRSWAVYSEPVSAQGRVLLRARASDGRSSREVELN
ncbi:carbohydate-binding domain-containing protein [Myxococcus sp. CA051A]|uniref:family 20 glycosylhydrolase n=1 Tax=Myxococcus sp. CA051A TaxID=2741739 RepID=UPI00157A4303|nr:family 20 glycosylhydrolase [Myxococcus sp. CA051A]NTX60793.1 carbohydate-binding domain-containing protein [Myxococcus sp. CA051A]